VPARSAVRSGPRGRAVVAKCAPVQAAPPPGQDARPEGSCALKRRVVAPGNRHVTDGADARIHFRQRQSPVYCACAAEFAGNAAPLYGAVRSSDSPSSSRPACTTQIRRRQVAEIASESITFTARRTWAQPARRTRGTRSLRLQRSWVAGTKCIWSPPTFATGAGAFIHRVTVLCFFCFFVCCIVLYVFLVLHLLWFH